MQHNAVAKAFPRAWFRYGLVGMMGTFIDTILIGTMTGLVVIVTGLWSSGLTGAALPGFGHYFVAIALTVFAFTTILSWAY